MSKRHIKVEVTGKVQGVWFRKSTAMKAYELGLVGYVENCANGAVYLEAEGAVESLEALIQWCHEGPELAQVKDVVVFAYEELKGYESFEIK